MSTFSCLTVSWKTRETNTMYMYHGLLLIIVGVVIFQYRFKGIQFASRANSSYLWPSSGAKQAVYTATYQKKT